MAGLDAVALRERLAAVQWDMAQAARRAGRDPASVRLVAVSKKQPVQAVEILAAAGQVDFGENYVQEALAKMAACGCQCANLRWHCIGGLQSNKVRLVVGAFVCVQSVDSLKLARTLHKCAADQGLVQEVLLQVNLAGEAQKSGVAAAQAEALAREMLSLPGLRLTGLMLMPPWDENPEVSRPWFAALRRLRDGLETALGVRLPELSMGLSHDFAQAIEEGATMVRVGTRVFGPRQE